MSCLVHTKYSMYADVLAQTTERERDGSTKRVWDLDPDLSPAPNITRGITGAGIRVVGATEDWGEDYDPMDYAKMQTSTQFTRRHRIKNIRDQDTGRTLWTDEEHNPMEFEVLGVQPILDPFGQFVEYDVLLKRVTGD